MSNTEINQVLANSLSPGKESHTKNKEKYIPKPLPLLSAYHPRSFLWQGYMHMHLRQSRYATWSCEATPASWLATPRAAHFANISATLILP